MSLINDLNNYLKPRNSKYKKKSEVWLYLRTKLGSFYYFEYRLLKDSFCKSYCKIAFKDNLTENRILVYFLNDNVCLAMSINKALSIICIKNIIQEEFKEKPIKFKFYDPKLKCIFNGPKIVISTLSVHSIIMEDDSTLFSKLEC